MSLSWEESGRADKQASKQTKQSGDFKLTVVKVYYQQHNIKQK